MRLICVVPATDSPETVERCLDAIRSAQEPPDEVVCVTEPPGIGPAAARNLGAERTEGELLAFVDSDVVVRPDAFARLRAAFEADPGLDGVFGAYDEHPEAPGPVSGFRNLLHRQVHLEGAGPAETFWAGLGAVRRDAFDAAGGFDSNRFPEPSVEDIDLGMRMTAAGARIRLDPSIQGTHLKEWTLPEMVRTDLTKRGIPWTRLILESGQAGSALNLGLRHRAGMVVSALVLCALLARRPRAALLGMAALVALNPGLYALIWRERGPAQALAALPLHIVHHLTGAAAGAAGLAAHTTDPARSAA